MHPTYPGDRSPPGSVAGGELGSAADHHGDAGDVRAVLEDDALRVGDDALERRLGDDPRGELEEAGGDDPGHPGTHELLADLDGERGADGELELVAEHLDLEQGLRLGLALDGLDLLRDGAERRHDVAGDEPHRLAEDGVDDVLRVGDTDDRAGDAELDVDGTEGEGVGCGTIHGVSSW